MTKEEAGEIASDASGRRWEEIAVTKDVVRATRIANILDKYEEKNVAQHIRGKCVYSCLCVQIL